MGVRAKNRNKVLPDTSVGLAEIRDHECAVVLTHVAVYYLSRILKAERLYLMRWIQDNRVDWYEGRQGAS